MLALVKKKDSAQLVTVTNNAAYARYGIKSSTQKYIYVLKWEDKKIRIYSLRKNTFTEKEYIH